jgi:hypothetical protein
MAWIEEDDRKGKFGWISPRGYTGVMFTNHYLDMGVECVESAWSVRELVLVQMDGESFPCLQAYMKSLFRKTRPDYTIYMPLTTTPRQIERIVNWCKVHKVKLVNKLPHQPDFLDPASAKKVLAVSEPDRLRRLLRWHERLGRKWILVGALGILTYLRDLAILLYPLIAILLFQAVIGSYKPEELILANSSDFFEWILTYWFGLPELEVWDLSNRLIYWGEGAYLLILLVLLIWSWVFLLRRVKMTSFTKGEIVRVSCPHCSENLLWGLLDSFNAPAMGGSQAAMPLRSNDGRGQATCPHCRRIVCF